MKRRSKAVEMALKTLSAELGVSDILWRPVGRDRYRVYDFHPDNSQNIEGYARLIENLVEKHIVKNKKVIILINYL